MWIKSNLSGHILRAGSRWAQKCYDWCLQPTTSEQRGQNLLKEWLSPEQLEQYGDHKYFDVTGSHSGKRYRIRKGRERNVLELDDAGVVRIGWCFAPAAPYLVSGDVMLAQKVALEANELDALAVAKSFISVGHLVS